LKKATLLLLVIFLPIISIVTLAPHDARAAFPSEIQVDNVDHIIAPIYGGLLLINDTVRISPTTQNTTITDFSIGFPLDYRDNLRFSMAYGAGDPNRRLGIVLDTGLGVTGYYGVTVVFPEGGITLNSGQSYNFTVVFVLIDLIGSSTTAVNATTQYVFTADLPVYPSLTHNVSTCHVAVILPKNTGFSASSFPFNATQKDGQYYLNYTKSQLPSFARTSTEVSFVSTDKNSFASFSVNKLDREIIVDANRRVSVSEMFLLESKTAFTVDSIKLQLTKDVSDVSAFDEQGRKISANLLGEEPYAYSISFSLAENQLSSFRLLYTFSSDDYPVTLGSQCYELNASLFAASQIIPRVFTLKIILPEGAVIQSFPLQKFTLHRDVFRETLSLSLSNITWLQDEPWSFTYSYTVLWGSFRPTLWATAAVIIGSMVAFTWQRPKAPIPVSMVLVPRKTLNDFVETYEGRKKALSELDQIKRRVGKGKVSRRRYKIMKTTLDNRLSTLSKRLTDLRQKIMSGGVKYADIMRQLEVAETELDNIEADINRIEVRFKRGEISAQTYRQLLEDDLRRKEKAKVAIDGLLLRLRE